MEVKEIQYAYEYDALLVQWACSIHLNLGSSVNVTNDVLVLYSDLREETQLVLFR